MIEPQAVGAQAATKWRPHYTNIVVFTLAHVGALVGLFTFSWAGLVVLCVLSPLFGLGITLGFHRLFSHRSFKTYRVIRWALAGLGAMTAQRGVLEWVAHHRMHHAHPDAHGDPHDASQGFWYSHAGWLFRYDPLYDDPAVLHRYAKDIASDPVLRILSITSLTYALQPLLFLLLYLLGGWSVALWGVPVRLAIHYHATFLVNSVGHRWGYRRYPTPDLSRNSWWVALLTYGEGWHNNHHAFPAAAQVGHRWWELDVTWLAIRCLELMRLAWDVRLPEVPGRATRTPVGAPAGAAE